jgi:hypothetical protein
MLLCDPALWDCAVQGDGVTNKYYTYGDAAHLRTHCQTVAG